MCFDRNINENRDVKFLGCDYLLCAPVGETYFSLYFMDLENQGQTVVGLAFSVAPAV